MSKAELRRRMRARLAGMTPAERAAAGERIAERVWSLPQVAAARTLLLYAALPEEVPTAEIAREARRRGLVVTYPRCLPETREMALHRIGVDEELVAGSYGLLEPREECPLLATEEIDVALVPGLAWDRAGHRLGRGAGYYDRLFARSRWRGARIGLFFALQEAEAVPADAWDRRLDAVVTEDGNYEL
jgi:5-formyltetrahydrofolate cyclo-ligase